MRTVFNKQLLELAKTNDRIYMVLSDIGYGEIEGFAQAYPDRFFNCGVAEQNATGIAAGLALEGNTCITYSIANFPTLRCLEQIRNDVCYHNCSVKIVVIGGGLAYGSLGVSHHACEDLAIMRALPNMVVLAPGDPVEIGLATPLLVERPGPVYLRCGTGKEPIVHTTPPPFQIGKAIAVREGTDVTIISTGTILYNAVQAADRLAAAGVQARVLSMHTLKPLDAEAVLAAALETGGIVTVEEHQVSGGLGSAVAEVLLDAGVAPRRFRRLAIPDEYTHTVGKQAYLRAGYGLSAEGIAAGVMAALRRE
ncbi:MAG: transketolase family protein [Anaerolineae bacterium]